MEERKSLGNFDQGQLGLGVENDINLQIESLNHNQSAGPNGNLISQEPPDAGPIAPPDGKTVMDDCDEDFDHFEDELDMDEQQDGP